jgi:hypothetical protein
MTMIDLGKPDLRGKAPETWACVDCGINTAPGSQNREQLEQAFAADWENKGVIVPFGELSEKYDVHADVWKAAGMEVMGGCLCIGCLEKRLGRMLTPEDFDPDHPFNSERFPCTDRLRSRRQGVPEHEVKHRATWPYTVLYRSDADG